MVVDVDEVTTDEKRALPAVVFPNSRVLILGTAPGDAASSMPSGLPQPAARMRLPSGTRSSGGGRFARLHVHEA